VLKALALCGEQWGSSIAVFLDELYGGLCVSAAVEAGVDTTARAAGEEMCGRREWLALHVDEQV